MTNVVSREAVIEAIRHCGDLQEARECVEALPSAIPKLIDKYADGIHAMGYREGYKDAKADFEKKQTGEWLKDSYRRKCSVCGSSTCWTDDEGNDIPDQYCPNCGARMNIV